MLGWLLVGNILVVWTVHQANHSHRLVIIANYFVRLLALLNL